MGRTSGISGLAMSCIVAWTCFDTQVTLADDSHVIAESQQPASSAEKEPPRRWHSFGSEKRTERAPRQVDNYTGWLITGYLAAPLLFVGIPTATNEFTRNPVIQTTSFVLALGTAVMLPAIVHWAAGDDYRGKRAAIAFPTLTVGAIALGFLVGFAASPGDTEFRTNARAFDGAIGGLIGAAIAWLGWGLFDMIDTGVAADRTSHARYARSIRVALAPLPGGLVGAVSGSF